MADDPGMQDNSGRIEHQEEIDGAIADWTRSLDASQVLTALEEARVPAGLIYSVVDMLEDPHFQARGLFEEVDAGGKPLKLPAIIPKLSKTPGRTEWAGPTVGEHTREVLGQVLGLSDDEIDALTDKEII